MTLAKLKLRKSGTETFVLCILSTSRFQDVFVVVFLGTKRKNLGGGPQATRLAAAVQNVSRVTF